MWVKFDKVRECFRHFFGMCEVAATLGPVLKIDMNTITQDKVRAKVRVRDHDKIPVCTKITDKNLMIYRVKPELEIIVELGWYGEQRKHGIEDEEFCNQEEEMMKRHKGSHNQGDGTIENISLGSLNLSQYEEMRKNAEDLKAMQRDYIREVEASRKVEADLGKIFLKLEEMEEERARQNALRAKEELKIVELEKERKHLLEVVSKQ